MEFSNKFGERYLTRGWRFCDAIGVAGGKIKCEICGS